jgi:hypothetical protein
MDGRGWKSYLPKPHFCANIDILRGHSSVGRALAWHARGRGFESHWLHSHIFEFEEFLRALQEIFGFYHKVAEHRIFNPYVTGLKAYQRKT